jgi:hypothetical protein
VTGAQSPQSWKNTAPESFRANGQITSAAGGAATAMVIKVERYTSDADHDALAAALKSGGNAAFLEALRKQPAIGELTIGKRTFTVRWARTLPVGKDHRRVAVVTDQPVFFAGAGAVDAKPTAGYDLAVIEFTIDAVGLGKGTMAPAARVKAGGPTDVQVDDYSGKRIELMTVTRNLK